MTPFSIALDDTRWTAADPLDRLARARLAECEPNLDIAELDDDEVLLRLQEHRARHDDAADGVAAREWQQRGETTIFDRAIDLSSLLPRAA